MQYFWDKKMEWRDEGIILSTRKYGEYDAILEVLTRAHGRHSGLVKGGYGRRQRGNIQPGNEVMVSWRGRLESQLGTYSLELKRARVVSFLYHPAKLAALNSCCSLLCVTMPENEIHEIILDGFLVFLTSLEEAHKDKKYWAPLIVRWELGLLNELGFGLNLENCVATGITNDLVYVSPKSGRSVSKKAGEPYHDKLFRLPPFILGTTENIKMQDIIDGLSLTEFFIERYVLNPAGKNIPQARRLFKDYMV